MVEISAADVSCKFAQPTHWEAEFVTVFDDVTDSCGATVLHSDAEQPRESTKTER